MCRYEEKGVTNLNTILEEYASLEDILDSFDGMDKEFNWILSDLDANLPTDFLDYCIDHHSYVERNTNIYLIEGERLREIAGHQESYFIWGVFSAFEKTTKINLEKLSPVPYAEDNPDFWVENPRIQHPQAVAELVLWDSSLVLLLSKNNLLSNKFRPSFISYKDLNTYNS